MVRKLIGKWLGYEAQIVELEEQVKALGYDSVFGVYCRNAFLSMCKKQSRSKKVFIYLDFDGIHRLNTEWGYEEVNRKIKDLFKNLRSDALVGRLFSGDEICISLSTEDMNEAEVAAQRLEEEAEKRGLSFTYEMSDPVYPSECLEDLINAMAESVLKRKAARGNSRATN